MAISVVEIKESIQCSNKCLKHFLKIDLSSLFYFYVYSVLPACMPAGQKRVPGLITDDYEPPCGY